VCTADFGLVDSFIVTDESFLETRLRATSSLVVTGNYQCLPKNLKNLEVIKKDLGQFATKAILEGQIKSYLCLSKDNGCGLVEEGMILREMHSVESTEFDDRLTIGDQNKEKYRKVCVSHFNKCFGHYIALLLSRGCCNKLTPTCWFKEETYSLKILEARSPK